MIYYPPLGIIKGKIKNITLEGIAVDLGPIPILLMADTLVQLAFKTDNETMQRISAIVVHSTSSGTGFMFCDSTAHHAIKAIRNTLNAA